MEFMSVASSIIGTLVRSVALSAFLTSPLLGLAAEPTSPDEKVMAARLLLDRYYGDPSSLQRAGALLDEVLAADDNNAEAYVQAARLTIKGGHIVSGQFQEGTIEKYHALLDKALSIDANNHKALMLKAEAFSDQGNYTQEAVFLDRARAISTQDPWLWVDYGRHSRNVGDLQSAWEYYSKVQDLGVGTTSSARNAYIQALYEIARLLPPTDRPKKLRELAELTYRQRDPLDAWSLGNFANLFIYYGMFDDAIAYAEEAVQTMNYGAGRLSLAIGLYCKAAQLMQQGKLEEANKLVDKAHLQGFGASAILQALPSLGIEARRLTPIIGKLASAQ
jgi:tetratricopeptide (TPR) repeat protein